MTEADPVLFCGNSLILQLLAQARNMISENTPKKIIFLDIETYTGIITYILKSEKQCYTVI